MFAAVGAVGGTQGFEPVKQTCPIVASPFVMPLTLQTTAVSGVFVTTAENVARPFTTTLEIGGTTLTATLLTIVTLADADAAPATARIVSGFVAGKSAGAAYVAEFAPVIAIVPRLAFPPTTPFTSQTIVVPGGAHSVAAKN